MAAPVETKVKVGSSYGAATAAIVSLFVILVPQFHDGVPVAVVAVLPAVLGWVAHTVAAYLAPHTSRTPPASPPAVPAPAAPAPPVPVTLPPPMDPEAGR